MKLIEEIRNCRICEAHLPFGPRPVVQVHPKAKILVVGQAPGIRVHESGVPFSDPSGDRLREWMGITREVFYDETQLGIVPMGFCYPGTGKTGDLPPRKECAPAWRKPLLALMTEIDLVLVIGKYAYDWHLKDQQKKNLTETVRNWREYWPEALPLPHPSPRNNIWLKKNPWFEEDVIPRLRTRVADLLQP